MASKDNTLPKLIKDITLHYVKFYYEKHLKEKNIARIEEDELRNLVNNLYDEKQKDLRDYIRNTLKSNLKDEYPRIAVENILNEMFQDKDLAKEKVIQEILVYQNSNNKTQST